MLFSLSCTDISIQGSVLSARCRNASGKHLPSQLDLNTVVGNDNGKFNWDMNNFSKSATNVGLNGAFLCAQLRSRSGRFVPACLNLNFCIENANGALRFKRP